MLARNELRVARRSHITDAGVFAPAPQGAPRFHPRAASVHSRARMTTARVDGWSTAHRCVLRRNRNASVTRHMPARAPVRRASGHRHVRTPATAHTSIRRPRIARDHRRRRTTCVHRSALHTFACDTLNASHVGSVGASLQGLHAYAPHTTSTARNVPGRERHGANQC